MPKYLIVGASASGIGAVEAIREVDPVGSLAIISEETCPQYSRPMISDFVSGKADFKKMKCRTDEFWKENNVEALTCKKATSLDLTEKTVVRLHILNRLCIPSAVQRHSRIDAALMRCRFASRIRAVALCILHDPTP